MIDAMHNILHIKEYSVKCENRYKHRDKSKIITGFENTAEVVEGWMRNCKLEQ